MSTTAKGSVLTIDNCPAKLLIATGPDLKHCGHDGEAVAKADLIYYPSNPVEGHLLKNRWGWCGPISRGALEHLIAKHTPKP